MCFTVLGAVKLKVLGLIFHVDRSTEQWKSSIPYFGYID